MEFVTCVVRPLIHETFHLVFLQHYALRLSSIFTLLLQHQCIKL